MITKSKFRTLDLDQKGEYVFQKGDYIGVSGYYNYRINLYSLYDFFVEVWYEPEENKIEKIELLESDKNLDLYIDTMNKLNNKADS